MSDVTIPAETAREIAALLRGAYDDQPAGEAARYADLLDPRPPLRDAVAGIYRDRVIGVPTSWGGVSDYARVKAYAFADAALAVVRDHIAARPHPRGLDYAHDTATEAFRAALVADLGADR